MSVLAVIPARYASTRFPGKPLAAIAGKPMIRHVWERACGAKRVDGVLVATDDQRIADYCAENAMDFQMTSDTHETGTDRMAEVAAATDARLYVNVQGDEPLIDAGAIDAVVQCLEEAVRRGIEVATGYIEGASPEQLESRSVVQLVPTEDGCVLTFSRLPVPHPFVEAFPHTVHVGMYAFTRAALLRFAEMERGPVERAESIELIRFLEHGSRIACVPIPPGSIGVDHPEDIARVEAAMEAGAAPS
jgi:3-deoxy-manno-octulosonate cytidylyltransferase (CMP-KDO synthetase)